MGSYLVTYDLVNQALDLAAPLIETILVTLSKRNGAFIHLVVLNPVENDGDLSEDILGQRTYGPAPINMDEWKRPCSRIAYRKAELSRRTGHNSGLVATHMPVLLIEGDTHFEGGVNLCSVPVGASGAESAIDEMCSHIVASIIIGLTKLKLAPFQKEPYVVFLGDERQ